MNLFGSEFKRKFSASMYKNLKIQLGKMSFSKDFVNDTRGDLYPVMQKSDDCAEHIENNCYTVADGTVKRLFCQFFPFATYEMTCRTSGGEAGFCFCLPEAEATVSVCLNQIRYTCNSRSEVFTANLPTELTLVVSCRPGAFDIYFKNNGKPEYLCTFYEELFCDSNR